MILFNGSFIFLCERFCLHVCICITYPQRSEQDIRFPGIGVTDSVGAGTEPGSFHKSSKCYLSPNHCQASIYTVRIREYFMWTGCIYTRSENGKSCISSNTSCHLFLQILLGYLGFFSLFHRNISCSSIAVFFIIILQTLMPRKSQFSWFSLNLFSPWFVG